MDSLTVFTCVCVLYPYALLELYSVTFSNFLSFSVLALFFVPLLLILVYYNISLSLYLCHRIPLSTLLMDHIVEVAEREVKESWFTVDQPHQLTEEQQLRGGSVRRQR